MTHPVDETSTEVLIIGGGLVGCSAALALRRRNVPVLLVERGDCGAQSSGVNFGGVRQQGRHLEELPLAVRSRSIWSNLAHLIGDDGEFEAIGHLRLARSDAHLEELAGYRDRVRDFDLDLEVLDRAAIRRRYPWLGPSVAGGSLCASDGHANPRVVSPRFALAAAQAGARIIDQTAVSQPQWDGTAFTVQAGALRIRAKWVFNCAGAWAGEIARALGEQVPLTTIYPNMIVSEPLAPVMTCCLGLTGSGFYARQARRGNIIIGGVRAADNDSTDSCRPMSSATIREMEVAMEFLPWLRDAYVLRTWTGIEGALPDGMPVIGRSNRIPQLIHAFGFGGHGFQLAPGVGEVLSELMLDGHSPTNIAPFDIDRFSHPGSASQH
jgi:sarcosine oxidase subunit beta